MKKLLIVLTVLLSINAQAGVFQIKLQPVSFLIGLTNVELGYGVDALTFVAGGASADITLANDNVKITEVHAGVDYMLTKGWYVGAHASRIDLTLTQTNSSSTELTGEATATGLVGRFGYRWQWPSFFMELGAQYASYSFDKLVLKSSDGSTSKDEDVPNVAGAGLDFRLGWVF